MSVRPDALIGTTLAGYRVEAVLGRGGMSVVYLAEDSRLRRRVALKLIASELAEDDRFRRRFLAESELAASLDHPNVIPVYEAGEADGALFIAMRYVEGSDLKELLAAGALEPSRTIAVAAQIAGALDSAHARGLVHRDVKPSNVLIDPQPGGEHVYLADFGLTRRVGEAGVPGGSGLSLGTPEYVAPEQIEGHDVDGRADVYSLGCLLYECLTGEPPFRGASDAAVLFAHLDQGPPTVTARRLELPQTVDAVIAKALAKDPDERYDTCGELVSAARGALGVAEPARSRWLRLPVFVGLAGLALIAAGLAAYFAVSGGGGPPPLSRDSLVRIDPRSGRVAGRIPVGKNPNAVAVGRSRVWVSSRGSATVQRIDPRSNKVDLEAPTHGAPTDLAVSGRHVVVANGPLDAGLVVIDASSGAEEDGFSLASGSFFGSPSIATDKSGVWVATGDRRVGRLNIVSGTLVDPVVIRQPTDERADAAFSSVAVGEGGVWAVGDPVDSELWRIDPSTGRLVATIRLPFAPKDVAAGAGSIWVTSQLDDTLARIDPATNAIAARRRVGRGAAGVAVGFGSVWLANAVDGTVSRIDPRTLRVETIDVAGYPNDVAVGAGGVWVTARA